MIAGELAGDVAAADDRASARGCSSSSNISFEVMPSSAPGMLRHERPRAGGDQQVLGGVFGAGREPHAVRVGERRPRREELHPGPLQACRGRPPRAGRSRRPSPRSAPASRTAARSTLQPKPARVREGVGEAAGVDQELLRHAAADHAGAAVAVLLGQRRPARRPRPRPAPRARRPSRRRSRRGRSRSRPMRSRVLVAHQLERRPPARAPGRCRTSVEPSARPITTVPAMPMKSPCSTTPGSAASAAASAGGSPMPLQVQVEDVVALVGDERPVRARRAPRPRRPRRPCRRAARRPRAASASSRSARSRPAAGRRRGAATRLLVVGDHHHAAGSPPRRSSPAAAPRRRP